MLNLVNCAAVLWVSTSCSIRLTRLTFQTVSLLSKAWKSLTHWRRGVESQRHLKRCKFCRQFVSCTVFQGKLFQSRPRKSVPHHRQIWNLRYFQQVWKPRPSAHFKCLNISAFCSPADPVVLWSLKEAPQRYYVKRAVRWSKAEPLKVWTLAAESCHRNTISPSGKGKAI